MHVRISKPTKALIRTFNLRVGKTDIRRVGEVEYPGIYPDAIPIGETHANYAINKVKRCAIGIYLTRGSSRGASTETCLLLYKAMVWSTAHY